MTRARRRTVVVSSIRAHDIDAGDIAAVVDDMAKRHKIDRRHVFGLGWSSGGPPLYAASLQPKPVLTAIMPSMSIFYPGMFPPLERAKDRPYYIFHSPEDEVCKFELAKRAEAALNETDSAIGFEMLSQAIHQARGCFERWGLASGEMGNHIQWLFSQGAYAVKPTGSGDGGYVLSLWRKPPPQSMMNSLTAVFR